MILCSFVFLENFQKPPSGPSKPLGDSSSILCIFGLSQKPPGGKNMPLGDAAPLT